jgi:hypothetical protein
LRDVLKTIVGLRFRFPVTPLVNAQWVSSISDHRTDTNRIVRAKHYGRAPTYSSRASDIGDAFF